MGAFAMVMVCIWNGCFNSIQVICRERDVIKREHRSGMHISSYIASHMLYQALLCMLQTGVTLYVTLKVGVRYDLGTPMITPWFIVDYGISMFLITYASDMMSLWVSTIAHSTTTAMTIMPFVLIFQLVFSGGMLSLPAWSEPLTWFTISNPGLKVMTAQADYNNQPLIAIWKTINGMRNSEVGGTVNVGQVLDMLTDADNAAMQEIRAMELGRVFSVGEVAELLENSGTFQSMKKEIIVQNVTVGDILNRLNESESMKPYLKKELVPGLNITVGGVLNALLSETDLTPMLDTPVTRETTLGEILDLMNAEGVLEKYRDVELDATTTVGKLVDMVANNPDVQAQRDKNITVKTTVGKLFELLGEENVKTVLETKAAEAGFKEDYVNSPENILNYWSNIALFILAFAVLSTITLEFIDKDKR